MNRRWFGTDGIRGRAGEGPLARPFLVRLGRALAEQEREEAAGGGLPPVLLARDTRESGPAIGAALAEGLRAAGVSVVDLGVLPTPGMPLALRARGARRGVVVSASHNHWEDNGLKLFGSAGKKLSDEQEQQLERRVLALGGESGAEAARAAATGTTTRVEDGAGAYVAQMLALHRGLDLSGRALVVDCAHGAAACTAPRVLAGLGACVTAIGDAPDGRNINAGCGSTDLAAVSATVRRGLFDLGLAFDGDADRVLLVDAGGRSCSGDHVLGFLGRRLAAAGRLPGSTVVGTVMSNLGLERSLAQHGLSLLRTAVGDRYVLEAMRTGGYALGGEASGHVVLRVDGELLGDGLHTALTVLEGLAATGATVADVVDALAPVPQVLLNVPVATRPPLEQLPALVRRTAEIERAHPGGIRIVLRYSGTESLARVMVEGLEADLVLRVAQELAELWRDQISWHAAGKAKTP